MQIFVPYSEPIKVAQTLWPDKKRFNKQIIECRQIVNAIDGVGKRWFNHPVVRMYKPYKDWLVYYLNCLISYRNFKKIENSYDEDVYYYSEVLLCSQFADECRPPFLTDEFCDQHKRRLFTKAPELYPQFEKYGKSEENWYVL